MSETIIQIAFLPRGTVAKNVAAKNYGENALSLSIEDFLKEVEKKAFRMAEIATQNSADALDIVQDTMIKLVEKYSDKPAQEWKPLFYRILQSRITDHFRRRTLTNKIFFWKSYEPEENADYFLEQGTDEITPERELTGVQDVSFVIEAIKQLPHRQQQCFLLRSWEGFSVSETASAMSCSEGSVKTHYARAKQALQKALEEKRGENV